MLAGAPAPLGATVTDGGVNFAVHASVAEAVTLCLFDGTGHESRKMPLPECTNGVWHGFLPGAGPGQAYGYRVHGPYRPSLGLRCNPHKLLVDPYAKALAGEFHWHPSVFDYQPGGPPRKSRLDQRDSAAQVPKGVVVTDLPAPRPGPRVPWAQSVFYELNVRGYTMRHPDLSEAERGRFRGLKNEQVISYLRSLGITAVELMPVHWFVDEEFLVKRGLRNYWGYNTLNFFTPAQRYGAHDARAEFVEMVDALHDPGRHVTLFVVYHHTAEGDHRGPTVSFRGFDNAAYYRLARSRLHYINDTGCGNTLDADSPVVQDLVVDSLRYWAGTLGVDGFRFDLATVLGRHHVGFSPEHPLLERIREDAILKDHKLLAEPWDPGPGGYQLGAFGPPWAELNDRFRDTTRRYWRGESDAVSAFAKRLHGSADVFEGSGRGPAASVNYVTNHDGYTLLDAVSYEQRHNEANGEDNRDGHAHNYSANWGVEGPTDDAEINALRRRQRLNLLASVVLAQGTPFLLAGDEFGHTQNGNNNAYAQDNETTWLDWGRLGTPVSLADELRRLLAIRRDEPLLQVENYLHGTHSLRPGWPDIAWLTPGGLPMGGEHWQDAEAFTLLLAADLDGPRALALMLNAGEAERDFLLADYVAGVEWSLLYTTGEAAPSHAHPLAWTLPGRSIACLRAKFV